MASQYSDVILAESSLQSYWKLDEASGNAADSKGAITGVAAGTLSYAQSGATRLGTSLGNSIKSNGSTPTAIDCGNNYAFSGTSNFTLEAWINRGTGGTNRLISKIDEAAGNGYQLAIAANKLYVWRHGSAGYDDLSGSTTLSDNTWYHIACTYDGSNLRLYVNGVLDGTKAATRSIASPTSNEFSLFASSKNDATRYFYGGYMQHVAVYNAALSAAAIKGHYTFLAAADAWAWTDSAFNAGYSTGGHKYRTTADAWAWSDSAVPYWRDQRVPVLAVAAGPNTLLNGSQSAGAGTITVDSTTGFDSAGTVVVVDTTDVTTPYQQREVTYTGKTGTTFTGCTWGTDTGGSGTFPDNCPVSATDAHNGSPNIVVLDSTPTPRLLLVSSESAGHASMVTNHSVGRHSSDGGHTWGTKFDVGVARVNAYGYGRAVVGVTRMKNGRLIGFQFEQNLQTVPTPWLTYLVYSDDDGATWTRPGSTYMTSPFDATRCVPPIEAMLYEGSGSNATYGDLYVPVYGDVSAGGTFSKLMKVTDGGASGTWTEVGTIATKAQTDNRENNEAIVIDRGDGTWIAHIRVEAGGPDPRERWQATSTDNGATWTGHQIAVSELAGHPVLFQMPEGHLVSQGQEVKSGRGTYGSTVTFISTDGGATWPSGQWRQEATDATYSINNGSTLRTIPDTTVPARRVVDVWAHENSAQSGAQVWFQWYAVDDFPLSSDAWAWSDTATRTTNIGKTTADSWAWTDSATGAGNSYLSRTTSDAWAWSETATQTAARSRTTTDAWAWSDSGALPSASFYSRTTTDTWAWTDSSGTMPATIYWLRARRSSSMNPPTKTYTVVQPKGTTKTATWTSPTYKAETEAGILVVLDVTAASGTGGLTLRINAHDLAGAVAVPLNAAPTAVTGTGTTSYALYPFGAVAGSVTQATSFYLPRQFSITVTHGDSSSYTYSVGYCLLP